MVLSHKELLRDCLGPDLAGKLERDGLKTLNEAETNTNDLKQDLKVSVCDSIMWDSVLNEISSGLTR